jgi:predicted dithiol-disulfide oxidoreductase (DUF899 family)
MTERSAMNLPPVISPTEWQAAREALLVKEKEGTRARDALAAVMRNCDQRVSNARPLRLDRREA